LEAFEEFILGPFVNYCLAVFGVGLAYRLVNQLTGVWRKSAARKESGRPAGPASNLLRHLVPLHKLLIKRPLYMLSRAGFHLALLGIVAYFSGHMAVIEDRFEISAGYTIPGEWVDWLALMALAACVYFALRRLVLEKLRSTSSITNWLLLLLTLLTLASGYGLTHGTFDGVELLAEYMQSIHYLMGGLWLALIPTLVWSLRQHPKTCLGCAACAETCPTGTLAVSDDAGIRSFAHGSAACLSCGACVASCPVEAAMLAHDYRLLTALAPQYARQTSQHQLQKCSGCGEWITPEPQDAFIRERLDLPDKELEYLAMCKRCRVLRQKSPRTGLGGVGL
jgi:ferredoxin